jgi:hypothetical protein
MSLGGDERKVVERVLKKYVDVNKRNWFNSAQDRNYWRVLVNATLKLWVP